jgi:hypothetical protein
VIQYLPNLRHKIADASWECDLYGKVIVELEDGEQTSDLTANQVAELLLQLRSYSEPDIVDIEGKVGEDTEGLIRSLC